MPRSLPTVLLLPLVLLVPALAGTPARAADQHTAPRVDRVVRNPTGRVRSCRVSCTLIGKASPKARFTLHRQGDYDGDLAAMNDATKRGVAAGTMATPVTGRAARWVSGDISKQDHATQVELDLDFGDAGLEGSQDPAARWLLTSAHFRTAPTVEGPAPHVFAAETAPVQRPDSSYYFRLE